MSEKQGIDYWKDLVDRWGKMADSWASLYEERIEQGRKATALIMAASIRCEECSHLTEYAQLTRELFDAADAIYVTPKVSQVSDACVHRLMNAVRALDEKMRADGLPSLRR